jgi:hypothetical protein
LEWIEAWVCSGLWRDIVETIWKNWLWIEAMFRSQSRKRFTGNWEKNDWSRLRQKLITNQAYISKQVDEKILRKTRQKLEIEQNRTLKQIGPEIPEIHRKPKKRLQAHWGKKTRSKLRQRLAENRWKVSQQAEEKIHRKFTSQSTTLLPFHYKSRRH